MCKRVVCLMIAGLLLVTTTSVLAEPFSISPIYDVELGNDSGLGPDGRSNGSGLGARNVSGRRRVAFLQYDISALKVEGEIFQNVSLSNYGHDQDDPIEVYGIIESQDDVENVEAAPFSWRTAPGVQNDPLPELDTPVALDMADVVGPLLVFIPPAQGERASTETSDALADFLNSDTDGTVLLMFAVTTDGQQAIIRARQIEGGSLIEGETGPAVSAFDPQPANDATVSVDLAGLCWTNPDPNILGTAITSDVYFGTGEPNELLPGYGYELIASGIEDTCVTIPVALEQFQTYYWVVNCYDPSMAEGEELLPGRFWKFNTNNEAPIVNAGDDQYVWLGNAGDPETATVQIDATATDDGLPAETLTLLWEQIDTGPAVTIDPNDVEDLTLVISAAGTYEFRLTADDTDQTSSDTIQIVVAETPCLVAQAMPGYQAITGDFDGNCIVDLADLAELAAHWLECNSLLCP